MDMIRESRKGSGQSVSVSVRGLRLYIGIREHYVTLQGPFFSPIYHGQAKAIFTGSPLPAKCIPHSASLRLHAAGLTRLAPA